MSIATALILALLGRNRFQNGFSHYAPSVADEDHRPSRNPKTRSGSDAPWR